MKIDETKSTVAIRSKKTPLLPDSYSREEKFAKTLRKMSRRKHHRGLMESVSLKGDKRCCRRVGEEETQQAKYIVERKGNHAR